jgi:peptidoglycan/xylan/chitin deacetylase (PgdA/CDA1 family)
MKNKLKRAAGRIAWTLFFWICAVTAAAAADFGIREAGSWLISLNRTEETGEGSLQESDDRRTDDITGDNAGETEEGSLQEVSSSALTESRYVALTFDDGPHPVYTERLLDGLAERQVQATFFVIGENIPGNESLILRMQQEGHLIGNHTYHHVKICDMSGEDAWAELEQTSTLIRNITGKETEYVRPPFGAWNKSMETAFPMFSVLWDVDPLDWTTQNTSLVVERVLKEVEDGDIILLHDCYSSSVDAALEIIDTLKQENYQFVTVDQLILS